MSSIYPWQASGFNQLNSASQQQRLPHAVLLLAKYGSGEVAFVSYWSQLLLCERPVANNPCHECKNCRLFEKRTHPDFIWIETEEGKKQISIQQVRQLSEQLHETSHQAGWRIVVIYQAERLTVNSYNALLKTLEEPGENTHIILLAADKSSIPATIVSRCQQVSVDAVNRQEVLNWLLSEVENCSKELCELALSVTHYVPFKAVEFIEQEGEQALRAFIDVLTRVASGKAPATIIGKAIGTDVSTYWPLWEFIVSTLLRQKSAPVETDSLFHQELLKLAGMMDLQLLFKFRDELLYQNKQFIDGVTLNLPMQIDAVADLWSKSRAR